MTIEQATIQLAELMARKTVNTKDIKTTAEGRSILMHAYKVAYTMLEELEDRYNKAMR